jgi:hypothetical protein
MDDLITKRIVVIGLVQVVLLILVFAVNAGRGRGDKTIEPASGATPAADPYAWHPQSWAWPVGIIVLFVVGSMLWRPVSNWYWSHNPPASEHRSELLETASKQLHCPAEQLTVELHGNKGAKVTGCAGNTQLCWGRTNRSVPPAWIGCDLLY